MRPDARVAAAITILNDILAGASVERTLTTWARQSRFAGSGDRNAVRDLVYDTIRHRRSYAWVGKSVTGRGLMIGRCFQRGDEPGDIFTGLRYAPDILTEDEASPRTLEDAPTPVKLDCQDWLWPELSADLGADAQPILMALQKRANVFLRANLGKTTRSDAIASLATEEIGARPHDLSDTAIEVTKNARRVQNSETYRQGLVEVQDAASQAVVDVLLGELGDGTVLDYCAGGGGKALALAAGGARAITAHDADPGRMKDLTPRAERAAASIAIASEPTGLFDAVLCDAPCSGSGAWRRQPEAKWTLTPEGLDRLTMTQDSILDRVMGFVAPGGCLAYATCSLLARENGGRVDAFLVRHPGWREKQRKQFTPLDGGDGFFISVLARV